MDTHRMFRWAGKTEEEARTLTQEAEETLRALELELPSDLVAKEDASVIAKRLCAAAQLHGANLFLHQGGATSLVNSAGPSSFGNSTGLLDTPVGVSPLGGLTRDAPVPQIPWVCHPAAPNWPHPVNSFTAVQIDSEDLVRLCTMVSCPTCGEVHPADKIGRHYGEIHRNTVKSGADVVQCQWEGCPTPVQWSRLAQHIEYKHIEVEKFHCPYCHRTSSLYVSKGGRHRAKECEWRDAARRGEEWCRKKQASCQMWCRAWTNPERLPQYEFTGRCCDRAVITGPARLPS